MTWFITIVTLLSIAFIKTGLGKRIAYNLLLFSGKSTLSLGYILTAIDFILIPATGSNISRTSIIFPIFESVAEEVGSMPEKEPRKLGAYFTMLVYCTGLGSGALFLTGMVTNAITISLMQSMFNITISWMYWIMATIVPSGLFLVLLPYALYKVYPPTLKSTEGIKPMAKKRLLEMGLMSRNEKTLLGLFIMAIILWIVGPQITIVNLNVQVVGFLFFACILLFRLVDWDDVIGAKGAWSLFIWYGLLYGIAINLASGGFYHWMAKALSSVVDLSQINGVLSMVVLLLLSIVVRYMFVASTVFAASFYPVLFAIALTTNANLLVLGLLLAVFADYGAMITHYCNGSGLIVFASNYVPQGKFWAVGTCMLGMAIFLYLFIGLPYWHVIGIW